MGGHRFSKMDESNLQEYTEETFPHIPGSLPSPATAKHALSEKPEHYILSELSNQPVRPAAPGRQVKSRRISVKSTITGKINPSNNFAASHDESHDDSWGEDARSSRTRAPLSPTSSRGHMSFSGFGALSSVTAGLTGEPGSFLTFRSGDGDFDNPQMKSKSPHYTILSDSPLKAGPTIQSTPLPKRALTQRSLKGGSSTLLAQSREEQHEMPRMLKQTAALDNLIAALDHTEERRQSNVPSIDEFQESNLVMAEDEVPITNPFRDAA